MHKVIIHCTTVMVYGRKITWKSVNHSIESNFVNTFKVLQTFQFANVDYISILFINKIIILISIFHPLFSSHATNSSVTPVQFSSVADTAIARVQNYWCYLVSKYLIWSDIKICKNIQTRVWRTCVRYLTEKFIQPCIHPIPSGHHDTSVCYNTNAFTVWSKRNQIINIALLDGSEYHSSLV